MTYISDVCPSWGAWKPWGSCSHPCYIENEAKPVQDRYRCLTVGGVEDCGTGPDDDEFYQSQERKCNANNKCAAVCQWSPWGQWSDCNPDCKQGLRLKRRTNNEDEGAD